MLTQIQAVMPAEAGIQVGLGGARALDSRFRGNDEWKLARIGGQSHAEGMRGRGQKPFFVSTP